VDTPKGDLDASGGQLTDPSTLVVVGDNVYPKGTYEQYPRMEDSDGNQLINTAHAYSECSNKGICDRDSGTCDCFAGYEGSACQRASCPMSSNGVCSGHGTCKTISELASDDNSNVYKLWDEDKTMGCDCDAGYTGPDCSARVCKYGADPLYYDDFANVRFANFTMQFYMTDPNSQAYGNYSIIFTDVYGEDWETDPIDINAACSVIQDRLESLPNNVIPTGSVLCYRSEVLQHTSYDDDNTGQLTANIRDTSVNGVFAAENGMIYDKNMFIIARYIIAFPGNPGEIKTPRINKYLDGARPTLFTTETSTSSLGWHVFPNGFTGESTDYVNDECEGVLVSIKEDYTVKKYQNYLVMDNAEMEKRLKECLGDSNGVTTDNVEVYDWDYGTYTNPHLIKLVDATQDEYVEYLRADGSSYKVLQTDASNDWVDSASQTYPVSLLCNNGKDWVYATAGTGGTSSNRYWGTTGHSKYAGGGSSGAYLGEWGFCKALNPPGFYAIMYFDDCSVNGQADKLDSADHVGCDANNPWRVMTAINRGESSSHTDVSETYGADTKFHVFTTKGTMQQVSQYAQIYTSNDAMTTSKRLASYHSNVIYSANTTAALYTNNVDPHVYASNGQMDCETMESKIGPASTHGVSVGALDCLDYGDKVFFLNLGTHDVTKCMSTNTYRGGSYTDSDALSCKYTPTATSYATNPQYVNMYTVKKISFEPASYDTADAAYQVTQSIQGGDNGENTVLGSTWETYRRQIVLDYGLNANYMLDQNMPGATNTNTGSASQGDTANSDFVNTGATVYKFYPPTLATTGTTGYNYVAECSNRGICDSETGLCNCFPGYSGDDCGMVSSLVQ